MAEMVSSAIVGETVSRIVSGIIDKHEDKSDEGGNIERLEMAHIRMEAALETSNKWQITDASLLRWRKKLKRAAQDCDDAVRRCKQLALEHEEMEQEVRQSSFPRRIAHATKSFISSFVGQNNDDNSSSLAVRRFERLADGANEFMRFVQLGGTPRQYLFFDPLIRHIFEGKTLGYQMLRPGGQFHYFAIRPMSFEERGLEAMLSFINEDCKVPKNSFRLGFMLRLSESTDIIGIAVKCLQLVTPHFKSTAEVVIKEITQLPTQDFSSLPQHLADVNMGHWNFIHRTFTAWFRPDPLCCKGYEHSLPSCGGGGGSSSSSTNTLRLSSIFPEPVFQLFFQRHISLSEYNNLQGSTTGYDTASSLENFPPLKLGILCIPHDSMEDHMSARTAVESFAIEAIDGEKQHFTHINVHPHQLDEMLLPKAIDYLYHSAEATTYQMCWRSQHGSAHLCVEKTSTQMLGARRGTRQGRNKSKVLQMQQKQIKKGLWKQIVRDFLKLWVVRSSDRLRSSFTACLNQYS